MKKILLLVAVMLMLCSCKQTAEKEEYIEFFIDTDSNRTFYIATPSGTIVYSTDSETYYTYVRDDGSIINIKDYMEVSDE